MINLLLYQIVAFAIDGKIFLKIIQKINVSNKLKMSARTWNELPNGLYAVSDIEYYWE